MANVESEAEGAVSATVLGCSGGGPATGSTLALTLGNMADDAMSQLMLYDPTGY